MRQPYQWPSKWHLRVASSGCYPEALRPIISRDAAIAALEVIRQWPGYAPTGLHHLKGLAASVGVRDIWYKDESTRFDIKSFKALGGGYAVCRLVQQAAKQVGRDVSARDVMTGQCKDITVGIHVSTATDGNHGRAVAWAAEKAGCPCTIYIHAKVSEGREREIARFGATVIRIEGNYDDSVHRAQADATAHGRVIVSDTSYEGYTDIPRLVMQGYGVMLEEILQQTEPGEKPTHVFLQGGVGALAAGVAGWYWDKYGEECPAMIVVEPEKADCLYQSARAGHPVVVEGELDTMMAGLACGEVSLLAWEILSRCTRLFMTIPDEAAAEVMRLLAAGVSGDRPVVAGESAVAGLAGCLLAAKHETLRSSLRLNQDSRVLILGTEGDSDPELYRRIVGRSAEEVRR